MPKKNPKADKAEQLFKQGMKLIDIAAMLDVPDSTVRRWKSTYKWRTSERSDRTERSDKIYKEKREEKKRVAAEAVEQIIDNEELNDQRQLFCLHYSKSFNATRSYMKAYPDCSYESAMARSSFLMKEPRIQAEIRRLKQAKMARAMLDPEDIVEKYIEITFSDITNYVTFGQEEVDVVDENGESVTVKVNRVRFKDSDQVDGSLIQEVGQGKDGVKMKLISKEKALSWLADHMDLASEEQKARVDKLRAETARIKGEDPDGEMPDDGFMDALNGTAAEDWSDEE